MLDFLKRYRPDILALQETKVEDQAFPVEAFNLVGYHTVFSGQKTYNGVALLSQEPLQDVCNILPHSEEIQRRFISACFGKLKIINIYVPNGFAVDSDKYSYKLNWLTTLSNYLQKMLLKYPNVLIMGDCNIAPEDEDVYSPQLWKDKILVSTPERMAFKKLLQLGLWDSFRLSKLGSGYYTWWDYRKGAFYRNHGLRIDHILCSESLSKLYESSKIDISFRQAARPSDHAPVLAYFQKAFYDFI